ncbi:MAG: gamma-butyrobetaine hydroxylase-like domain-containing protein [Myxococcota bacterium]
MSEAKDETTPVEIRAPEGARQMEIDWADGHTSLLPHRILRGYCPCAQCQGHEGPIRYREGGDLELAHIEPVGNYAIRLGWADGHATGIYRFPLLRALCRCRECAGRAPDDAAFAR